MEVLYPALARISARFSGLSTSKMRCVFPGLVLPKCEVLTPEKTIYKKLFIKNYFFYFSEDSTSILFLEVLNPEKCLSRLTLTLAQFYLFNFSGDSTSILCAVFRFNFGSTEPGKTLIALNAHTHAGPILPFFIFPGTVLPKCTRDWLA